MTADAIVNFCDNEKKSFLCVVGPQSLQRTGFGGKGSENIVRGEGFD